MVIVPSRFVVEASVRRLPLFVARRSFARASSYAVDVGVGVLLFFSVA